MCFSNVDLNSLGYNKLLSTGNLKDKIQFNVDTCSAKVEEKVKAAGGEVKLKETASEVAVPKKEVEVSEDS